MRKGISPVVAVVLLIAIAVIAAVAVWFWVGPLTQKPAITTASQNQLVVEQCDTTNGKVKIRNAGALTISAVDSSDHFRVYQHGSSTQIGYINMTQLSSGETAWMDFVNTTATSLTAGEQYDIEENKYSTVTFTC